MLVVLVSKRKLCSPLVQVALCEQFSGDGGSVASRKTGTCSQCIHESPCRAASTLSTGSEIFATDADTEFAFANTFGGGLAS